ncbi:hypothetical protein A6U85_14550 [Agrobacterium sp. 13-626]|uniref:Uncharacterized protein n=2 Tax=Rhizobium rhizogenes TaxID=359 RepID=A0AA87Q9Y6_RHIRH|nr:hypothetical protein DXT98_13740 [Agrobacterium sp. ICMP 7243]KEA08427.1 hypothetical protein CN09_22375 [Rhizobium rhizogenes]MQB31293.1 hypothetical protein [Rhizobium rhizogenes]OCI95953.1 hypothetical protein A6U85_14550 [Agrobacterium sp. 13-626]GAJ91943.1 hypothetical protein RRH01S_03_00110 [Rhizobium rhizogenes NBRC 13257]
MSCPECGQELTIWVQGMSLNVTCNNCGWTVATTNRDHAAFDETTYTVRLDRADRLRSKTILDVSTVLGIGVIQARLVVDQDLPVAQAVTATSAMLLRDAFVKRGLQVVVEPPLPWNPDGTRA